MIFRNLVAVASIRYRILFNRNYLHPLIFDISQLFRNSPTAIGAPKTLRPETDVPPCPLVTQMTLGLFILT